MALRSIPWLPACLAAAATLVPASAMAQSTVRAGSEFRVNVYTTGAQRLPSAARSPDGTYFVVWESQFQDGDSFGIFGRRLSAVGVPLGSEFQINQATFSDQKGPSVAVDATGRFTVVWTGQDVSGGGVFARQYSSAGPLGPEFQVNTYTTGDQFLPRVSAGPGGIGVVWQSTGQDGSGGGVYGRLLSPTGAPISAEFLLSNTVAGNQTAPAVAALDNGRYAAAWIQRPASGSPHVFSRLFDAAGAPSRPETQITFPPQFSARRDHLTIAAGPVGTFVVGWWEAQVTFAGKGGYLEADSGIALRFHDVNGNPTTSAGAGGAGHGSIARWEGALGVNFTGRLLVSYTSTPGILTCFQIPPPPPPGICAANGPEDGSGSGIFARAVGAPTMPPRVQVNTFTAGNQTRSSIAPDPYGNTLVLWQSEGQDGSDFGIYAQRFGGLFPSSVTVDPAGNGVLDPGQTEEVRPAWLNLNGAAQTFGGSLFGYGGPAGPVYSIVDGTGSYGTVANGATQPCTDCYLVSVSQPATRPAVHWDSFLGESLTPEQVGLHTAWPLHVGGSFTDVFTGSPYYRFVETMLHHGITSGCGGTQYCPAAATTREQMAVFVLTARHGAGYAPPACTTPMFADVPASSPFCRWIEELARRGVAGGCGGGNFCPAGAVTREQMSVFVLRTLDPAINPPACTTPVFADVPAASPFCRWIEELARRGVVSGCGGGNYCPTASVTREQMAVFLAVTFGLRLY